MTPEERYAIAASMARIEQGLAATIPAILAVADCAKKVDAYGLATAALLLKESFEVYASEMRRYAASLDT